MIYKLKENRVYRTYLGGKHIDEFYEKSRCKDGFFSRRIGLLRLCARSTRDAKTLSRARA